MKENEEMMKRSREDALDCLAYLEHCCQDDDAGYYPYVIMNYIRGLEAESGLFFDKSEEEQYYKRQLAKYREMD